MSDSALLDPVAAYDRIAQSFSRISETRQNYLRSIEQFITVRIPASSRSLLDVGAGDGSRSARIAKLAGLTEVVLLEPSAEMVRASTVKGEVWAIRAEDLPYRGARYDERRFDVITCLWNVLGHIPHAARPQVLRALGKMLTPGGMLFLDINHRYNAHSYGLLKTAARYFYDSLFPGPTNGDVEVAWETTSGKLRTFGHVFADGEVRALLSSAGLAIEERIVVDYSSGEVRRFAHQGNLLYVLRCNSSRDSASAWHTSSTSASVI
jgi:2-polyprenyl-3-methyl-5-hydroxy-6-metoxy-1,4-benzoquinol methylase